MAFQQTADNFHYYQYLHVSFAFLCEIIAQIAAMGSAPIGPCIKIEQKANQNSSPFFFKMCFMDRHCHGQTCYSANINCLYNCLLAHGVSIPNGFSLPSHLLLSRPSCPSSSQSPCLTPCASSSSGTVARSNNWDFWHFSSPLTQSSGTLESPK